MYQFCPSVKSMVCTDASGVVLFNDANADLIAISKALYHAIKSNNDMPEECSHKDILLLKSGGFIQEQL